ncbi:MAG TPA: hypothetical protein VIJ25_02235, partial [Methylococcales bacterium]
MSTVAQFLKLLTKHNQGHLLAFWDELSPQQQKELLAQIEQLDFDEINGWIEQYVKNSNPCPLPQHFDPAPYYPAIPDSVSRERCREAIEHGQKLLSEGKVAAFVVAGGQGTRLGYDGPKGNFPISPVKNKTLFTLFAEMIAAASKKYGTALTW